ncbi:hypothetical protein [Niallia nealsonii]|uniref:Uncharacterized protein n=1 Tax=Niallia nealsonii TaxID=115979 RepID=A0A2N0Z007_9BACI|nr:hypothetical protein [Niallia nealsonii]PKG22853.1 hypothetical protein CWS01_14295 [Niallia nealsonii]
MQHDIQNELKQMIHSYKYKPYLPFWGEVYFILYKFKKNIKEEQKTNLFLYKTKAATPVFYLPDDGKICIELPEFKIIITEEEFIDNLLKGRFWPE